MISTFYEKHLNKAVAECDTPKHLIVIVPDVDGEDRTATAITFENEAEFVETYLEKSECACEKCRHMLVSMKLTMAVNEMTVMDYLEAAHIKDKDDDDEPCIDCDSYYLDEQEAIALREAITNDLAGDYIAKAVEIRQAFDILRK